MTRTIYNIMKGGKVVETTIVTMGSDAQRYYSDREYELQKAWDKAGKIGGTVEESEER